METVKVCTYFERDASASGKLEGLCKAVVWDFDGEGFANPRWGSFTLPYLIPSRRGIAEMEARSGMAVFKRELERRILGKIRDSALKLASENEGTAKWRAMDETRKLWNSAFEGLDDRVSLVEGRNLFYVKCSPYDGMSAGSLGVDFLDFKASEPFPEAKSLAAWQMNYPFCIFSGQDDNLEITKERLSVDDLLKGKIIAWDIETTNWQQKYFEDDSLSLDDLKAELGELAGKFGERIPPRRLQRMGRMDVIRKIQGIQNLHLDTRVTASAISEFRDGGIKSYVITTLNSDEARFSLDLNNADVEVLQVGHAGLITHETNRLFRELNPLFVAGHWHTAFDYFQMGLLAKKARAEAKKKGGLLAEYPEFRPSVGSRATGRINQEDFEHSFCRGRIDVDASHLMRMWGSVHSNKLDAVTMHLLGIPAVKSIASHDQLEADTKAAEEGDRRKAYDICYYAAEDTVKSLLNGDVLLPWLLQASSVFNSQANRVARTSPKSLANDVWVKRSWDETGTLPEDDIDWLKVKGNGREVPFEKFSAVDYFHSRLREHYGFRAKRGIVDGTMAAFFPWSFVFEDLLRTLPNVSEVFDVDTSWRNGVMHGRVTEALARYPLVRLKDADNEYVFNEEFSGYWDYCLRLNDTVKRIAEFCDDHGVINKQAEFFVFPADSARELEQLCASGLGVYCGRGVFLSGDSKHFVSNIDGETNLHGMNDPRSNRYYWCDFEKDLVYRLFFDFAEGMRGFLDYLSERAKLLASEAIPESELAYRSVARMDASEQSDGARTERSKDQRDANAKKGDRVVKSPCKVELQRRIFGLSEAEDKEGFFVVPRIGAGSVSDRVSWAFNGIKEAVAPLYEIYRGRGNAYYIDTLMNLLESSRYD